MPAGPVSFAAPNRSAANVHTLARYTLYQIPGWLSAALILTLLWHWEILSPQRATVFWGLWVVKDFAFYPFVKSAYRTDARNGAEILVGGTAVTVEALAPAGYVRVRGELWRAEGNPADVPIPSGTMVRITAARGFTLDVCVERSPPVAAGSTTPEDSAVARTPS